MEFKYIRCMAASELFMIQYIQYLCRIQKELIYIFLGNVLWYKVIDCTVEIRNATPCTTMYNTETRFP